MSGYIFCFIVGVAITYMFLVLSNKSYPMNRDLKVEELSKQGIALRNLENKFESMNQIVSAHTTRTLELRDAVSKINAAIENYEKSFGLIHQDYIRTQAEIIRVERRYAALTPVHIHYKKDLPDEQSHNRKIQRRNHTASV